MRPLAAAIGLLLCSPALAEVDRAALMETAGRTHMAIVHFPIALIIAAAIFEIVRILTRRDRPSPAALGCLAIAVVGAAMAATTGWWHADFDSRTGEPVVELHRWIGIAGGSLGLVALVLGLFALGGTGRVVRRLYVLVVIIASGTIGFAGHQGGEVTFGEGYVLEPIFGEAPAQGSDTPRPAAVDLSTIGAVNFEQHLLPIFEASCIECHGTRKQNGKLRLDSLAALEASPYFDEVVVAGDAAASSLHERITLPKSDHDFMPKRGDPLPEGEIALIELWINTLSPASADTGAVPAKSGADLTGQEPDAPGPSRLEMQVIAEIASRGGHASLESASSGRLVVNLSVMTRPITDEDLAVLRPVADSIVELNVGGVGVTDEMMPAIGALTAIERLNLSRSDITDSGVAALSTLDRLEVLNLYGSPVTDGAVPVIGALPALKRVYIWRTMIGTEGRAQLAEARPGLEIIAGAEESAPEAPQAQPDPEPTEAPDGE